MRLDQSPEAGMRQRQMGRKKSISSIYTVPVTPCNQYWGLEALKGDVKLIALLDAETQCSVCVKWRMSAAPHLCVVRSWRGYGKNKKRLFSKEAGVVSGLFSF